jgi:hypothetical protein
MMEKNAFWLAPCIAIVAGKIIGKELSKEIMKFGKDSTQCIASWVTRY